MSTEEEDEENCDPLPLPKLTPPGRLSTRLLPLPNLRLNLGGGETGAASSSSSPTTSSRRPRGVRLFEQRGGGLLKRQRIIITSPVTAPKVTKPHPRLLRFCLDDDNIGVGADGVHGQDDQDDDLRRRRKSEPAHLHGLGIRTPLPTRIVRKSRLTNINPFTPAAHFNLSSSGGSLKRMAKTGNKTGMFTPTSNASFDQEDLQRSIEKFIIDQEAAMKKSSNKSEAQFVLSTPCNNTASNSPEMVESPWNPSKRLRVSDINIARYDEEFVELRDIATGEFGQVKIARHRLDGMVYAIKVTRSEVLGNNQERAAMNEVFAHAAFMKHKHVVRYYNSWVENNRIFIQNEYCEGGSLANLIKRKKDEGKGFSENELKKVTTHLAKGLQYIHSKNLVHLDIKPENIFLALDHLTSNASDNDDGDAEGENTTSSSTTSDEDGEELSLSALAAAALAATSPFPDVSSSSSSSKISEPMGTPKLNKVVVNDSTDSGNASDGGKKCKEFERISYKIGDLGHVAQINGDYIPEEGDCRYFAPELLLHDVDRDKLPKADIFSLGLTLYECATLVSLPKNSSDDPIYQNIRSGNIPYVAGFSKEFNQLIKLMTDPDVMSRPSAGRILSHPFVKDLGKKSHSNLELYKELKSTRLRLKELESQIAKSKGVKRPVGKGTKKSKSSYQ